VTTNEDRMMTAAMEVFRRVAGGESLTYRLCQEVCDGTTVRPGVVFFQVTGWLSGQAKAARLAAE
jgi:hypothetical protein